jgi:hypothetical protein
MFWNDAIVVFNLNTEKSARFDVGLISIPIVGVIAFDTGVIVSLREKSSPMFCTPPHLRPVSGSQSAGCSLAMPTIDKTTARK